MRKVEKAGMQGLIRKRNPGLISANDFFHDTELLRKEFATLINVDEPKRIVVVPSASYGLATVAKNVKVSKGDKLIVASEQFPSNYYPWQRLAQANGAVVNAVAAPPLQQGRGAEWNNRILEAIDHKTKVVALGHVHWADGTRFDLERIRQRTSEVGSLLIIDGTQSVGAFPFDVQKFKPDALVCSGYKWLMGPYSIGLAYYGRFFDGGIPIEENWINRLNSENFAGLVNYESSYQPQALRYEMGERSNFILVPMMLEALRQINLWKPTRIQEYCHQITKKSIAQLREVGYWVEEGTQRGHHLFGLGVPKGKDVETIRAKLAKEKIFVSVRGNFIRVSPHVYNSANDLQRLVRALS
jgi:selenocysteine lyase/cysteine desulfurase